MFLATITIFCSLIIASSSLPASVELEGQTHSRVINGYEVDISEVPYQASLRRKTLGVWTHFCGATIIGTKTLLTAAHCVTTYLTDPTLIRVNVGTAHRLANGKSFDVKRIVIHENYSSESLTNDIALLVIHSKMSFSRSINAVTIAPKNYFLPNGSEALVSGFGTVAYQGSASSILLAAKVKIVDQSQCRKSYLGIAQITDGMICASGSNPPRDACQGDSGGPLIADNILIGIVSWGEKCADQKYPGVYTRVSEYDSWISRAVNQYS